MQKDQMISVMIRKDTYKELKPTLQDISSLN